MLSGDGALKDSAVCALLTAACGVLAMYLPPLFLVVSIILPAFPALLTIRRNLPYAAASMLAAAVLLGLAMIPQGAAVVAQTELLVMVPVALTGLLLGLIFKNRLSAGMGLLIAMLGQFLFTGVAWLCFWGLTGYNPFSSVGLQTALKQVVSTYLSTGAGAGAAPTLAGFVHLLLFLWPGVQITGLAVQMGATYLWTRFLLTRRGGDVPVILPFSSWHLPWYSIWSLIVGLGLFLAGSEFGWLMGNHVGGNLLYVAAQVYLVIGVAVLAFYFRRLRGMVFLKILAVFVLVIDPQVSAPVLIVVGVVDSIVNLRLRPGTN